MNNIIIRFLSVLTFFIITSCENQNDIKVIDKDKMVKILIEMHLTEESVLELKLPKDTLDIIFTEKEKKIFRKYMVEEEYYRKSYSYYFFKPVELESIYERVIDSLSFYQQIN